jgi:hypothetical protein
MSAENHQQHLPSIIYGKTGTAILSPAPKGKEEAPSLVGAGLALQSEIPSKHGLGVYFHQLVGTIFT